MRSQISNSVTPSLAVRVLNVEETLVVDERVYLRPAQAVEDRVSQMLESSCVGVSQLRLKTLVSTRSRHEEAK